MAAGIHFSLTLSYTHSLFHTHTHTNAHLTGTVKKGKAARQVIELLARGPEVLPREKDLIRASPEMDAINVMVGAGSMRGGREGGGLKLEEGRGLGRSQERKTLCKHAEPGLC
jgi:hypothetical protein